MLLPLPAPLSGTRAPLLSCSAVTRDLGLLQLGSSTGTRGAGGMGARGCLGPLLLLLLPPLPWGAGGNKTLLQPSIIGGYEAQSHFRPYMVSLQFWGNHFCGAALVHQRWALTAAHCLRRKRWQEGMLVVGLHNWRKPESGAQNFSIQAACPHPDYDQDTFENDLLLLQLNATVTRSRTQQLISLPRKEPAPGARCSLAGWGVRDHRGWDASPTLQEMEVTVMDVRMCNNSRFWKGEIGPAMICFQGRHRGSAPAEGDSGSPLVCGKQPAVAGVMSFNSRDSTDIFKPPVATSTVKYKKWIQKTLRKGCGSKHTG